MKNTVWLISMVVALLLLAMPAAAQFPGLTLPPGGDNQHSTVTQYMGMASVTIDYNSPDVHAPNGDDRKGKIWGQLVPWGMANTPFGNGQPTPWRVGANENTVVTVSHDVTVEGKPLAAGRYGLHMIPGEDEWTVVFSNNSSSWGSFFYEESEDALRVTVKPEKDVEYREWLTFEFLDRQLDSTLVAMHWENLRVPIRVAVPNLVDLYIANIKKEMRDSPGFNWQNWNAAAQFVLARDTEGKYLEDALAWSTAASGQAFPGQTNFQTLSTKAQVLQKMQRNDEAMATLDQAVDHPASNALQLHGLGRQLIGMGMKDKALEVFEKNHQRHDGAWPTEVGMARGLSAVGQYAKAKAHAEKALAQAPDDPNRGNLENMIQQLSEGKDVN